MKESPDEVHFQVEYSGGLPSCESVTEEYIIREDGIEIQDTVRGPIRAVRMYFPLLITNGADMTEIRCDKGGFTVSLGEFTYSIKPRKSDDVVIRIFDVEAPNRNGIYKIGCFEKQGNSVGCHIEL